MPKPKISLGTRPADEENDKIKAFLAEEQEPEAKNIIAASVKAEAENPPKIQQQKPPQKILNQQPNGGAQARSLSQLLQNGEISTQGGMVKRNFSVSRDNMNNIKRVVQIASNAGVKKTQDDVLNEILEDWFKSQGW